MAFVSLSWCGEARAVAIGGSGIKPAFLCVSETLPPVSEEEDGARAEDEGKWTLLVMVGLFLGVLWISGHSPSSSRTPQRRKGKNADPEELVDDALPDSTVLLNGEDQKLLHSAFTPLAELIHYFS